MKNVRKVAFTASIILGVVILSMIPMANSAKDPFWRAKVSHEVLVNPQHTAELEDKCTTCHAPMGNYTSKFQGHEHYSMADLLVDTIGLDGVSCGACHQLSPDNLGAEFSGVMEFDTSRVQYGPHENPFAPPMANFVGFTPIASDHINDANLCASCHTLITDASDDDFNETIFKTYDMLQLKTLDISLDLEALDPDSAYFKVTLNNKAGHKFPSGYPSRRAFIEFTVVTEQGDTLFKSGVLDPTYEVEGHDPVFEPHYQMINQSAQVQIYELVNGDINGDFSTVLERGFAGLKDNRLPPLGFSTDHMVYDTTQIIGNALTDTDFNKNENGDQGTGGDVIFYHIPLNNYTGLVDIRAKVFYQSLPPKWMAEMFGESTPEIETFRTMYDEADQSAVLINSAQINDLFIESTSVTEVSPQQLGLSPNPTADGWIHLDGTKDIQNLRIYNLSGQLMKVIEKPGNRFELPQHSGIYLIEMETANEVFAVKLLRL